MTWPEIVAEYLRQLRNLENGKVVASMEEGTMGFQVAAFSRDGKNLATGGIDRNVALWDVSKVLEMHKAK
jgi:hypothetical protein